MPRAPLLASLLVLPCIAAAQEPSGLYINLGMGANIAGELTASGDATKLSTAAGPMGVIDFGWALGRGFRAEIEGNYRSNSLDGIFVRRTAGEPPPQINPAGSLRTYAIMTNLAYDIPLHPFGLPLRPYIGAGLGYGWLDFGRGGGNGFDSFALASGGSYSGPSVLSFGSRGGLAYQAMVGASLPLGILPGLEATLEYRFFGMSRADVPVDRVGLSQTNLAGGAAPSSSVHNGFEFRDNAMLIGLRYRFWGY